MKHLRRFKENSEGITKEDIQEEAYGLLSHLIDSQGVRIVVEDGTSTIHTFIYHLNKAIEWGDYKQDIIPFITYMYNKYTFENIEKQEVEYDEGFLKFTLIDRLIFIKDINDFENIDDDLKIYEIYFIISK